MQKLLTKKAFLGYKSWLIPLPVYLIKKKIQSSGALISKETADVTAEERQIHRYVVRRMTDTNQAVQPENIVDDLDLPLERVLTAIDRLEALKVFIFRYNSSGINWAYPVTTTEREFKLTFDDGKECTAA